MDFIFVFEIRLWKSQTHTNNLNECRLILEVMNDKPKSCNQVQDERQKMEHKVLSNKGRTERTHGS